MRPKFWLGRKEVKMKFILGLILGVMLVSYYPEVGDGTTRFMAEVFGIVSQA